MNGRRVTFAVLAVLITASTASAATKAPGPPNPFRTGHTLVIPHAGGDALYPETTLYAYQHSRALGGDVIDLDVQTTSDGVLVALHDSTVDRTTNGHGSVSSLTFAEVQKLDAGWWFKKGAAYPFRGKGVRMPSIDEVLAAFPNVLATLDVKSEETSVVAPICVVLKQLHREAITYIGIETSAQVNEFRRLCPAVHTSGTDEERAAMRAARDRGDTTFQTAVTVNQPSYIGRDGKPRITQTYLDFAHARGIAVMTWVVDDPAVMRRLVAMGIDGIYTRRPDLLLPIVHGAAS